MSKMERNDQGTYAMSFGNLYEVVDGKKRRVNNIQFPNGLQYHFVENLGHGTFGVVYKAVRDNGNGSIDQCAVKCSKILVEDHNIREAHMMQVLGNANIVKDNLLICDSFIIYRKWLFQSCELLEMSLFDLQKTDMTAVTLPVIRVIMKQIFCALCQLELIRFIHGDIKPNNIMIVSHGSNAWHIKLIDFGLSTHPTFRDGAPHHYNLQAFGYKAPEIMLLYRDFSKIDMFSIGCVMLDLLTRRQYFLPHNNCQTNLMYYIYQLIGQMPQSCQFPLQQFYLENGIVPKPTCCEKDIAGRRTQIRPVNFEQLKQWCIEEKMMPRDVDMALNLISHIITWNPQDRFAGWEAATHPFITMAHFQDNTDYYNHNVMLMRQAGAWL